MPLSRAWRSASTWTEEEEEAERRGSLGYTTSSLLSTLWSTHTWPQALSSCEGERGGRKYRGKRRGTALRSLKGRGEGGWLEEQRKMGGAYQGSHTQT